jgi:hypothetical protein
MTPVYTAVWSVLLSPTVYPGDLRYHAVTGSLASPSADQDLNASSTRAGAPQPIPTTLPDPNTMEYYKQLLTPSQAASTR